jgi:hypothetical protein
MAENNTTSASTFGGFENALRRATFNPDNEKTRYDKLFSQSEILRLRDLISKEILCKNDISEIQNLLVSTEIKLTNFDTNDRYVLGKYLIWVNEYAKRYLKALRAQELYDNGEYKNLEVTELRKEINKEYSETFRVVVHTYCFLSRSPLSLGGAFIERLTTDRHEMEYKGLSNTPFNQAVPGNWKG